MTAFTSDKAQGERGSEKISSNAPRHVGSERPWLYRKVSSLIWFVLVLVLPVVRSGFIGPFSVSSDHVVVAPYLELTLTKW